MSIVFQWCPCFVLMCILFSCKYVLTCYGMEHTHPAPSPMSPLTDCLTQSCKFPTPRKIFQQPD